MVKPVKDLVSHNAELITKWSPNKCQNAVVSDFNISGPQDQGISCTRTPQRVNNSESCCAYCVEPHHDTDRCRHHPPVQCYSCKTRHKYK